MAADGELAAAVVGAAITVAGAAVIFVFERVVSSVSAYRDRRAVVFGELVETFTEYVREAELSHSVPTSDVVAKLISTRARAMLALGADERAFVFWLSGMQNRLVLAAALPATTQSERSARSDQLNHVLQAFSNTVVDRHQGRLTRHDMFMPSGLFWAEAQGVDIDAEFADEIENAMRPAPKGRWVAFRSAFVQDGIIRPALRAAIWLGLVAPFGWVPADKRAAAATVAPK